MQYVTDFAERLGVVRCQRIRPSNRRRPVEKQRGRITVERIRPECRATHRRDRKHFLGRYLKRNSAGRKHDHRRTGGKQRLHQLPTSASNLFAVVQYEQRPPIPQRPQNRSQWSITERTSEANSGSHSRRHFRRIGYCAERHPVHLATVPCRPVTSPAALCHLDSQSSLTCTSDATNRDEPPRMKHRQDGGNFVFSPNESGEISGERVGKQLFVNRHDGTPPPRPISRHQTHAAGRI